MALFVVFFAAQTFLRAQFGVWGGFVPWYLIGPMAAAIQRRPKVETLAVTATPEGLTVGEKVIPRLKLRSALLRHEAERKFVLLRGKGLLAPSVDVEVSDDEAADLLTQALALDARSTTAEFSLLRRAVNLRPALAAIVIVTMAALFGFVMVGGASLFIALAPLLVLAAALTIGLPLLLLSRTAKLRVGADGIMVRNGLSRGQFYSHDDISAVHAEGSSVILERPHKPSLHFQVAGAQKKLAEEHARTAKSIVWRIDKARDAHRALAGATPQGAVVLAQGERTVREWIEDLKRVGEGANVTFRNALLTRDQLLSIVESTSAAAKERLAAAVALRSKLTDDEKPRIRVAAERCVAPELRERMVRVLDASDEELEGALEEELEQEAASR